MAKQTTTAQVTFTALSFSRFEQTESVSLVYDALYTNVEFWFDTNKPLLHWMVKFMTPDLHELTVETEQQPQIIFNESKHLLVITCGAGYVSDYKRLT